MRIGDLTDLSHSVVSRTIDLFKDVGWGAVKPAARGRSKEDGYLPTLGPPASSNTTKNRSPFPFEELETFEEVELQRVRDRAYPSGSVVYFEDGRGDLPRERREPEHLLCLVPQARWHQVEYKRAGVPDVTDEVWGHFGACRPPGISLVRFGFCSCAA